MKAEKRATPEQRMQIRKLMRRGMSVELIAGMLALPEAEVRAAQWKREGECK